MSLGDSRVSLVHANPDGSFEFAGGLAPWSEARAVLVMAEGFEEAWFRLPATQPGDTVHEEVTLVRQPSNCVVAGSITLNGEPLDLTVAWAGSTHSGSGRARLGHYRLNVEPGAVELSVSLTPPAGGVINEAKRLAVASLVVEPDHEVLYDFALERPLGRIAGTVRWADGLPALHAAVRISIAPDIFEETAADALGAFDVDLPDLGVVYAVYASVGRSWELQSDVPLGSTNVALTLPLQGSLRIETLDAVSGEVVRDPAVIFRPAGRDTWTAARRRVGWSRTLADGTIELEVPAGFMELMVGKPAFGYPLHPSSVTVPANARIEHTLRLQAIEPARFRIEPALPRGHRIRVIEANGGTAAASLMARGAFRRVHDRVLAFDEDGTAAIDGLADGTYRLDVVDASLVIQPDTFQLDGDRDGSLRLSWTRR